jgi:hypothetical protein
MTASLIEPATFRIVAQCLNQLPHLVPDARHKRIWQDNIKIDLTDTGREAWIGYMWLRGGQVDWLHAAQGRAKWIGYM